MTWSPLLNKTRMEKNWQMLYRTLLFLHLKRWEALMRVMTPT
jgi:hypothetical protein